MQSIINLLVAIACGAAAAVYISRKLHLWAAVPIVVFFGLNGLFQGEIMLGLGVILGGGVGAMIYSEQKPQSSDTDYDPPVEANPSQSNGLVNVAVGYAGYEAGRLARQHADERRARDKEELRIWQNRKRANELVQEIKYLSHHMGTTTSHQKRIEYQAAIDVAQAKIAALQV